MKKSKILVTCKWTLVESVRLGEKKKQKTQQKLSSILGGILCKCKKKTNI